MHCYIDLNSGFICVGGLVSNQTYKRGQVEWALWRAFRPLGSRDDGPPPVFKTRIKRLLDLDREFDTVDLDVAPGADFAFVAPVDGGSGAEAAYAPVDAFCLGIGLDLLDTGFKQGEIVVLMRYLRSNLERWFPALVSRPSLIDRQNHLARNHPNLPVIDRPRGAPLADARVFMVLNRIELTEVLSISPAKQKSNQALFREPAFSEGVSGLTNDLARIMPLHQRTVIVLEVTMLAQTVSAYLEAAPRMARGRPRSR